MLKTEAELLERLRTGRLIEGLDTATEAYVEGLKRTLIEIGRASCRERVFRAV